MLANRPQSIITEGYYHAPTKTPARSRARAENAQGTVLRTVGKGSAAVVKTPFGNTASKSNHLLKEVLHTQGKPGTSMRQNRPLGDKTPFPNRSRNPDEQGTAIKIPKLVFLEQKPSAATPELQRPSSLRKHSRSRKSLQQSFQTPANNGRHWELSEEFGSPEVEIEEPILEKDDFDELEYMPPNTLDLPYQPPVDFDLPDYRELGLAFRRQVFSAPIDDVEPPQLIMPVVEILPESLVRLTLRDIDDDDPFRLAQAPAVKAATAVSRAKPLSSIPPSGTQGRSTVQTIRARPATAASSLPLKTGARATSTVPPQAKRPGTSAAAPIKPRVASTSASSRLTSKPTVKLGVVTKAGPSSRGASQVPRVASNPSTARSTPALRGALKAKPTAPAAPPLFKEVPLEEDDFMFEV